MIRIVTLAFLAFAPIVYLIRLEWRLQSQAKTFRKLLVLFSITIASNLLFFSYLVMNNARTVVYYQMLGAMGGPLIDLITRTYPSTGALCHVVAIATFTLMDEVSIVFRVFGGVIGVMACVGFWSTFQRNVRDMVDKGEKGFPLHYNMFDAWWT